MGKNMISHGISGYHFFQSNQHGTDFLLLEDGRDTEKIWCDDDAISRGAYASAFFSNLPRHDQ